MRKALGALLSDWFKAEGSVEEAVEVMTAAAKGLRRKYADRRPWARAVYTEGKYLIRLCAFGKRARAEDAAPSRER